MATDGFTNQPAVAGNTSLPSRLLIARRCQHFKIGCNLSVDVASPCYLHNHRPQDEADKIDAEDQRCINLKALIHGMGHIFIDVPIICEILNVTLCRAQNATCALRARTPAYFKV